MLKKRIAAVLLLAVLLCGLAAAPASAATYGTVVGGWLRLRANPSYDATVIASYKTGSVVTILSQSGGWARVMTADYRLGYMDQRYLYIEGGSYPPVPVPTAVPAAWTTVNRTAWVTSANGKGVRMRSAPEVNNYNVMGLYPVGRTVMEIKVSSSGWSYIRIDGKYGYMMSKFLTTGYHPWPGPTAVPYITPVPPTYVPYYPSGDTLTGVALNNMAPRAGDVLQLTVTPGTVKYSAVWYRADNKVLLSTGNYFTVTVAEVGTAITVRVTASDGTVAEVSTQVVLAAGAPKSISSFSDGSAPKGASTDAIVWAGDGAGQSGDDSMAGNWWELLGGQ